MKSPTTELDRAAAIRPHDPFQRAALIGAALVAFLGSLYLVGPGLGLAILFVIVAALILITWSWPVTIIVAILILGLVIGRSYVRIVRERVELRERERELDREIPF